MNYHQEIWISQSDLEKTDFSLYWNNEDIEKEKDLFYILDGNFFKMEEYLRSCGLMNELLECLKSVRPLNGVGIDIASGNMWAAPTLIKAGLEKLYCIDYSKHRMLKIGPRVLEHYNIPESKIVLVHGDFYNLKLEDSSVDFVFMAQAFHHARFPERLLGEVRRVLKKSGTIIMMGEPYNGNLRLSRAYIIHAIKTILRMKHWSDKLFSIDPVLGDRAFTNKEYSLLFSEHGFTIQNHFTYPPRYSQAFILLKR